MALLFFTFRLNLSLTKKGLKSFLKYWGVECTETSHKKLLKKAVESSGNSSGVVKGYFVKGGDTVYLIPGELLDEEFASNNQTLGLRANINSVKKGGQGLNWINKLEEVPKDTVTQKALEDLKTDSSQFLAVMSISSSDEEGMKIEIDSDYEDCLEQIDGLENIHLNNIVEKTKNKVEINTFDPKQVSSAEWVSNSVFAFELAGIKDQAKMVSKMLTKLHRIC